MFRNSVLTFCYCLFYFAIVGLNKKKEMKLSGNLILLISTILIFTSCSKIVYISKSIDPEIILEKGHHNIVFVNLFDYTSPYIVKTKDKKAYNEGIGGLMDGLSFFSKDTLFNFMVGDTLKKGIKKGLLTTLLPIDYITAICSKNKADLLLTVDSLNVNFDWKTTVDNDSYGNTIKTKNFYLNASFYVSLYTSTGELVNRSELDQSELYRSRPTLSGFITIEPSLARASHEVGNLGYHSGQDYVTKFYPRLIQDTKQLFTGQVFRESNNLIFSRNWNKAIELLTQLANSHDPDIAEKAEHNLEVAKEAAEASKR